MPLAINPQGLPAVVHTNAASAFGEVMSEINTNRPLILCFKCWVPVNTGLTLAATGTNTESALGGTYYMWGTNPPPNIITNAENEDWNFYNNGMTLGHAVTAVGYIMAGDADDQWAAAGLAGPTDWVIVHDNWASTAQERHHSSSTLAATGWPTPRRFPGRRSPDSSKAWCRTGTNPTNTTANQPTAVLGRILSAQSFAVNQWNDWCAPCSAANLVGHWMDYHRAPVADTTPFAGSTFNWRAGSVLAGLSGRRHAAPFGGRPAPQIIPGPLPATPTDIGWYMDSNLGVPFDPPWGGTMGGFFFGNPLHSGTYLKDIHAGLQNYLNSRYSVAGRRLGHRHRRQGVRRRA